jgi:hypothetical protein
LGQIIAAKRSGLEQREDRLTRNVDAMGGSI